MRARRLRWKDGCPVEGEVFIMQVARALARPIGPQGTFFLGTKVVSIGTQSFVASYTMHHTDAKLSYPG